MGKTHPSLRTALRSGLHTKCTFASIPVALHLTKWEWSVGGFKPCENLRHSGWWLSPMMVCEFRWTMVNKPSWDISWNINGIIPPLTSTNHAIINNPLTNHLLILTGYFMECPRRLMWCGPDAVNNYHLGMVWWFMAVFLFHVSRKMSPLGGIMETEC